MHDFRTRVIQIRFTSDPDGDCLRKVNPTHFSVVVLYTLEAAASRVIELAREIIKCRFYRPPGLNALRCTVEVTTFGLRPFQGVAWTLGAGKK
jgi:hypothetical protein